MPGPDAAAFVYGLCAAIAWGAGDVSGGFATGRGNVLLAVLWSQLIGAAALVVLAVEMAADMPQLDHLFYSGVAGVFGGVRAGRVVPGSCPGPHGDRGTHIGRDSSRYPPRYCR